MQVLLFTLGEARCALALTALTRVLPAAALTPVPGAPACVAGLLDLHGAAVPVLDLVQLAGGAPGPIWRDSRILLLPIPPAALRAAAQADVAAAAQTDGAPQSDAAPQTVAAAQRAGAPPVDDQPATRGRAAGGAAAAFAPPADAALPSPPAGADEAPRQLGLLAEHVLGVVRIDPAALADSGVARAPFVGRVVATADGLLQLIEPAGLLTPALRAALSWPEAA